MQDPATDQDPALAAAGYDELDRLLQLSPLSPSAAEAHGIFLGLLSGSQNTSSRAGAQTPKDRLLAELFPAVVADAPRSAPEEAGGDAGNVERCQALLADLATRTRSQSEGAEMEFHLLLPPEERPLRERAIAVHGWTRGFLFGLGLTGLDAAGLSAPAREAFDDLLEITRMDLDDLDDEQANEEALTEIVEFIRIAALMILEEPAPDRSAGERAPQETQ
jgi:uncharacterized protein YgfB (UPF0149 family)